MLGEDNLSFQKSTETEMSWDMLETLWGEFSVFGFFVYFFKKGKLFIDKVYFNFSMIGNKTTY